MTDKARLELRILERKIESKADAFWLGAAEAAGRTAGFIMTAVIAITILNYMHERDWLFWSGGVEGQPHDE
ncbi:hypothetical protein [Roseovarius atlanticus]|uniref:hypothetical protein n=1 Tax=Roseovarius atlanticus TaxID=1641875 RepID=UPI001C97A81C|nr:hypothetical protein [Roseovarius atlanticus]MBY5988180.1 hypothetical protein [Roseovarius atlanticus]MBY6123571.1 hypothetical protein [Roseovarius atlanticus]MBY6148066.1 hypothetical protein [Roseovarius atlanticus]